VSFGAGERCGLLGAAVYGDRRVAAVGRRRRRARRVASAATFGAISYYTQWFERLGAEPLTIIVAALTTVAAAGARYPNRISRTVGI
jgi:hypothetical protein